MLANLGGSAMSSQPNGFGYCTTKNYVVEYNGAYGSGFLSAGRAFFAMLPSEGNIPLKRRACSTLPALRREFFSCGVCEANEVPFFSSRDCKLQQSSQEPETPKLHGSFGVQEIVAYHWGYCTTPLLLSDSNSLRRRMFSCFKVS